jgi:hypothetical protein
MASLRTTMNSHMKIWNTQDLERLSTFLTDSPASIYACATPLLVGNGLPAPAQRIEKLTILPEAPVAESYNADLILSKVLSRLADHAHFRCLEVDASWVDVMKGLPASFNAGRSWELSISRWKRPSIGTLWPSRVPALENVTHLRFSRNMHPDALEWASFPNITHLALSSSDILSNIDHIIKHQFQIDMLAPNLSHILVDGSCSHVTKGATNSFNTATNVLTMTTEPTIIHGFYE